MVMVEVGAHAPTSHPSQSPSGTSTSTASQPVAGQNLEDPASWSKLTATCVWADTGGAGSTELSPTCLYRPAKGAGAANVTRGRAKRVQNEMWQQPEILVQILLDNSLCVH